MFVQVTAKNVGDVFETQCRMRWFQFNNQLFALNRITDASVICVGEI